MRLSLGRIFKISIFPAILSFCYLLIYCISVHPGRGIHPLLPFMNFLSFFPPLEGIFGGIFIQIEGLRIDVIVTEQTPGANLSLVILEYINSVLQLRLDKVTITTFSVLMLCSWTFIAQAAWNLVRGVEGTDGQKFAMTHQPHLLFHLLSSLYILCCSRSWLQSLRDVQSTLFLFQPV